ncbi:MAG: signal recognition particle protein [Pseudomonadota bacterium]
MFDRLQERFERVFRTLRGLGKIRESNIQEALAEVRASLLEADVQYRVVQSFIDAVRTKALGEAVLTSVNPGQQFIKIIYDELVRILGGASPELPSPKDGPLVILITGLQGSGKTTTAAKLALHLRDQRKLMPILVPADTARPAAREQLEQLAKENGLNVFETRAETAEKVLKTALKAVRDREVAANCVIADTAGRLHVDDELMTELQTLRDSIHPDLTLYVLDAMAGQDAVRAAEIFSKRIGFDGIVVTKLDGDARGGAALSVAMATQKPIYFVGLGERVDALERLHPDRMASRILGMGDVVSLVEKAQETVDLGKAEELAQKLRKNEFTIEDFQEQLQAMKKLGSIEQILEFIPGAGQLKQALAGGLPEKEFRRVDAIIKSMTVTERQSPQVLNGGRRKRIADGSGTSVADVNRFIKQFLQTRTMMSRLSRVGAKGMRRGGFNPFIS